MEAKATVQNSPKLLDRMRAEIRVRHYSIRTEEAYLDWARRFLLFHNKRHPQDMGADEVQCFLSHLAVERNVAASTQNQAKSALLFLYREVMHIEVPTQTPKNRFLPPLRNKYYVVFAIPARMRKTLVLLHGTLLDLLVEIRRFLLTGV